MTSELTIEHLQGVTGRLTKPEIARRLLAALRELEALKHDMERQMTLNNDLLNDAERMRKSLEWYADRENYDYDGRLLENAAAPRSHPPLLDRGERARRALDDPNEYPTPKEAP